MNLPKEAVEPRLPLDSMNTKTNDSIHSAKTSTPNLHIGLVPKENMIMDESFVRFHS